MNGKGNPFLGDVFFTLVGSVVTMLLTIMSYAIAARILTTESFGQYMLLKRVTAFIIPCVALGLPTALTRWLAINRNKDQAEKMNYVIVVTSIIAISFIGFSVFMSNVPQQIGSLLLGAYWDQLYLPMIGLIVGMVVYYQVHAILRGNLSIRLVNYMNVLVVGLIPLMVFVLFGDFPFASLVYAIGATTACISLLFLLGQFKFPKAMTICSSSFIEHGKEALGYGIPRVPGVFISQLMLSLGSIILAKQNDANGVLAITAGLNIVLMGAAFVAPVGVVLLPRGAEMVGQNRKAELKILSSKLIVIVIYLGSLVLSQWMILGEEILRLWLNFNNQDIIVPAMIVSLAIPFYMAYEILRNLLDAVTSKPLNLVTQVTSMISLISLYFCFMIFCNNTTINVALSTLISIIIMGLLTVGFICQELKPSFAKKDLYDFIKGMFALIILTSIGHIIILNITTLTLFVQLIIITITELAITISFIYYLRYCKIDTFVLIIDYTKNILLRFFAKICDCSDGK
jgi:O-antigen/teichoic acid export membrane protein